MKKYILLLCFFLLFSCTNNKDPSSNPLSFTKWLFTSKAGKAFYLKTPKDIEQVTPLVKEQKINKLYQNMSPATVTITDDKGLSTEELINILSDIVIYFNISYTYDNFDKKIIENKNGHVIINLEQNGITHYQIQYFDNKKIKIICN